MVRRRNVHPQVQQGGACINHGAMVKRCSHEGCTKYIKKGGLCTQHYRMSLVTAQDPDVEVGYEATTTGGGGILNAAPHPAVVPQLPPFLVGPPESVTVSIIIDNNDEF